MTNKDHSDYEAAFIDSDDTDESAANWQDELQSYRIHIVERIQYRKISAALQACRVLDREDDEELTNQYAFRTTKMRLNGMVDIILRKGEVNYKKFLEVLGRYYPDVYTEITGNKPPVSPASDDEPPQSDEYVQYLMQALEGMKQKNVDLSRKLKRSDLSLNEAAQERERFRKKNEELTLRVERYENSDSEMAALRKEVDRLKTENYTICMRTISTNDDNAKLRMSNMLVKNENDKLKAELQNMESRVALERTQSIRLRNRLQCSPSDKDIMEMKREIDELKLRLAQTNREKFRDEDIDMRIQILQRDKEEAIEMYAGALENLNKLREDCSVAEALRDKYLDEKEQLDLSCSVLRGDCDMYKMRRDSVWQQLQEVEKEREMLMKERNDAQNFTRTCMQEKARYRTEIRELEEKFDQVSQSYLECQQELVQLRSATRSRQISSECVSQEIDWPDNHNYLPINTCNSYPSTESTGSNANQLNTTNGFSDTSSDSRNRTYETKHYHRYLKKTRQLLKDATGEFGVGLVNVFPEINLAADYGPQDACLVKQNKLGVRRRIAQRPSNRTDGDQTHSETASTTSASNDENTGTHTL